MTNLQTDKFRYNEHTISYDGQNCCLSEGHL